MKQVLILMFLLPCIGVNTRAQHLFSVEVDSLARPYLVVEPVKEAGRCGYRRQPRSNYGQSDKELFHIRYTTSPVSVNGTRDLLQCLDVNVKIPLLVKGKTLLAAGLGYETLWTSSGPLFGGYTVQGFSMQWLLNRNLGDGRAILVAGSAGAYSDFKDLSGEDFRYACGIRYRTKLHDRLTMAYGLAVSGQFFGVMVAPFVDFDWKMTERLRLTGPFPLNTRLRYIVTPKLETMFFLKPDNATYRLSEQSLESRYFQKKQWNAGLGFDYALTRHWVLNVRGGYSLRRKFEIYEASQAGVLSILTFDLRGDKKTPYFSHDDRAFFAEFALFWILARD